MSTVFKRIVLPVLVINLLQILVFFVLKRNDLIISVLGGYGPGAYYVWVYLQLWALMPFLYKLLNTRRKYLGIVALLILCITINIFMNKVDALIAIPGKFNSMLCFRYIFLAAIAWIWIHKANYSKMLIGSLAVLSLCYLYFVMENNNVKPFIHPSNWLSQN